MPFQRPTLSEITDRIVADFQTRIIGGTSLLRRATLKIMARVLAGAVHLLYGYLDFQTDQLFISSADSEGLNRIADEYGIIRIAAAKATGEGQATGTNGITIAEDTELRASSGQKYDTDADVTIAAGIATLVFTAQIAGIDGNDDPAISLTFTSPIIGVNATVTVGVDGITDGLDEEIDDSLHRRLLIRKQHPPYGGAESDYLNWTLEVLGVTRAWIFPLVQGAGTVGVAFVRDNDESLIPNATRRQDVRDYLVEHPHEWTGTVGIPLTAEPGLFIIELQELVVDMDISISPNTVAVRTAVEAELEEIFLSDGGPEETIRISSITEAISIARGEEIHRLNSPVADITATMNQVHALGTITWRDY